MQSASTSVSRLDVGVVLRNLPEHGEEEPVRVLHDVRLRDARDAAAPVGARVLEREADDPLRALGAERLDRDARARGDLLRLPGVEELDHRFGVGGPRLELDPRVQVLGVLADDDQVDGVVARADALVRLAGSHARIQPELVAERDVDRAEARADRRRDRPLDCNTIPLDRVQRRRRKRGSGGLHHVDAGLLDVPGERDAGRLQHPAGRLGELGARAVAGDQSDVV